MNKLPPKYQIRVNPEQSAKAQELLFKHGYSFMGEDYPKKLIEGYKFILVNFKRDKNLSAHGSSQDEPFKGDGDYPVMSFKQWRTLFRAEHDPATYLAKLTAKRDKLTAKIEAMGEPRAVVEKYVLKGGEFFVGNFFVDDIKNVHRADEHMAMGRFRQTKEAAERARLAIIRFQRLLAYVDEHGGHLTEGGYALIQSVNDHYYARTAAGCDSTPVAIRMTEACAIQLAADLNSGRFSLNLED